MKNGVHNFNGLKIRTQRAGFCLVDKNNRLEAGSFWFIDPATRRRVGSSFYEVYTSNAFISAR